MSRRRRLLLVAASLLLGPWCFLVFLALLTPLPSQLRENSFEGSTRILDRHGRLLRHARAGDGTWRIRANLDELGPLLPAALIAAEDRRFYLHPGVDPLSIVRATGQLISHRRIVSGASTLTQQLARTLVPRPRTFAGKVREAAMALRIEASLSKRQILEEYLSRVVFGPSIHGVEATSRALFDKPVRELSLAQAALLAGMPQSPTYHDPRRHLKRAQRRRDWILRRMENTGVASHEDVERALQEPISPTHLRPEPLAPHFVEELLSGPFSPGSAVEITSTIEPDLQRIAEEAIRRTIEQLTSHQVSAAAVLVLDNASGEILAYVGSPSITNVQTLGANDGVLAKRQPGSSLKPFLYDLALERLHWSAATLLPDVEITFPGGKGSFQPKNYDGKFHGPVRLREALASSLNIPAIWTASQLGPDTILDRLHTLGFRSLDQSPEHYGVAIALGDGEVTLLELAQAYSTLARGGLALPTIAIRKFNTYDNQEHLTPRPTPSRVLDEHQVAIITDILSDPKARIGAFGTDTVLDFPFRVAAKTGTSKGFRDNITVGYTREVTVAVWVGNFDGRPMQAISGITGAGPLFHDVMMAAMSHVTPAPLLTSSTETHAICPLSGALVGPHCPHSMEERFLPGYAPTISCSMHRSLPIDTRTGKLAGPRCPASEVTLQRFEIYPTSYLAWARASRRPLPPSSPSPRCPDGAPSPGTISPIGPRIIAPIDGAVLLLDRHLSARQEVLIRIEAPDNSEVLLHINQETHLLRSSPYQFRWKLKPGTFTLSAEAAGQRSESISFRVEE